MSSFMEIEPEWIDYNGHLNMAYYLVLFDRGADEAFEAMGFGPAYAEARKLTTYTGEFRIRYLRELHLGSRVRISFQILDHDEKRFHAFQTLYHEDGWIAASAESLTLHVDMTGPKVVPMPEDIRAKVSAMAEDHAALPRPVDAGRSIGIRRRG
ncbi:(3S)-malyl-CoA thioesterase [Salinihabitans flavidus]|uniref:(3S)-malyl-CoA thioesterase n=1 Tax=Salinihabitans flavidus TaxID=569882 RepID=A0A1H8NWH4_9RHOB|nr:thioesterase family protein [Salinihabitans flavidus]SEO34005.1 (3S)-malyl-CoA thioesterase [Salinihabitans flavidus]